MSHVSARLEMQNLLSAVLLGGVAKQVNRTLKWDPNAVQFINDDEANRLLSIAKRSPWHT